MPGRRAPRDEPATTSGRAHQGAMAPIIDSRSRCRSKARGQGRAAAAGDATVGFAGTMRGSETAGYMSKDPIKFGRPDEDRRGLGSRVHRCRDSVHRCRRGRADHLRFGGSVRLRRHQQTAARRSFPSSWVTATRGGSSSRSDALGCARRRGPRLALRTSRRAARRSRPRGRRRRRSGCRGKHQAAR